MQYEASASDNVEQHVRDHCDEHKPSERIPSTVRMPLSQVVSVAIPTLVSGPQGKRQNLIAALEFVERAGSGSMYANDVVQWYDEAFVRLGYVATSPISLWEKNVGKISLIEQHVNAKSLEQIFTLQRIVGSARGRVLRVLSGLLFEAPDDTFIAEALKLGRVKPMYNGFTHGWMPTPDDACSLSDAVLSLFVADILCNRDIYNQRLSICVVCGHISFAPEQRERTRCKDHEHMRAQPLGGMRPAPRSKRSI